LALGREADRRQDPKAMTTSSAFRRTIAAVVASSVLGVTACGSSNSPSDRATGAVRDAAPCPPGVGDGQADLPRVSLSCLTAPGIVDMADLRGKPEVVNVWASWCAPCRQEMPMLERAHRKLDGRVIFLGVDVKDSRSQALAFLGREKISYPQVFDDDGQFPLELRLQGVPNTLFVDSSGAVVDRVIGRLDDEALAEGVRRLGLDAG
jgi:cytochrome c biogenesis protein CcmG/thiol:disulfide interchange protein DsbE